MDNLARTNQPHRAGVPLPVIRPPHIPVVALGMSLGIFLVVTFALCVGFDLIFPGQAMYQTWLKLLPGFSWLTWSSFLLGGVESFAYGWFVALIFAPLFNYFSARWAR